MSSPLKVPPPQTSPNQTQNNATGSFPAGEVEDGAGAVRTRADRLPGGLAVVETGGTPAGGEGGHAGKHRCYSPTSTGIQVVICVGTSKFCRLADLCWHGFAAVLALSRVVVLR